MKININKITILPLVFIRISFILREEHRLRVFENRVLRRIFGPKRDVITGHVACRRDDKCMQNFGRQTCMDGTN
jgi:hypothetical protein